MKNFNVKVKKQSGVFLTTELVLLLTILLLGLIVGLVTMRDALNGEMEDLAEAFGSLDQGYELSGVINPQLTAVTAPSSFFDAVDLDYGDHQFYGFVAADGAEFSSGITINTPTDPSGWTPIGTITDPSPPTP